MLHVVISDHKEDSSHQPKFMVTTSRLGKDGCGCGCFPSHLFKAEVCDRSSVSRLQHRHPHQQCQGEHAVDEGLAKLRGLNSHAEAIQFSRSSILTRCRMRWCKYIRICSLKLCIHSCTWGMCYVCLAVHRDDFPQAFADS